MFAFPKRFVFVAVVITCLDASVHKYSKQELVYGDFNLS